jgi:hypothetical protein
MHRLCPTVRNRILDDIGCHSRTGRHDCLQTPVMNDEVTNFTNAPLIDESPQHIRTVMTVGWLVKGLFAEEVTMTVLIILCECWGGGRLRDRRSWVRVTRGRGCYSWGCCSTPCHGPWHLISLYLDYCCVSTESANGTVNPVLVHHKQQPSSLTHESLIQ